MSNISFELFTIYATLELELDSPILEALGAYWSYVKHVVCLYVGGVTPRQHVLWLNDPTMDPGVRAALVLDRPRLIEYVDYCYRTYDVCWAAVQKRGESVQYTSEKFPSLNIRAVRDQPINLAHVPGYYRSHDLCLEAVTRNGMTLKFVPSNRLTDDVCMAAVTNDATALTLLDKRTVSYEVCLAAVRRCGLMLEHVPERHRTLDLIREAVSQNALALQYISNPSPEVLLSAIITQLAAVARHPLSSDIQATIGSISQQVSGVLQDLSHRK